MVKMERDLGTFFVLAGNYKDRAADAYPDGCMQYLQGGLLIGAVDRNGEPIDDTPGWEDSDAFAPGSGLPYPTGEEDRLQLGTSYGKVTMSIRSFCNAMLTLLRAYLAAPLVAGLVAYFRALTGAETDPASIAGRIKRNSREIEWSEDAVLVVWNEQERPDAVSEDQSSDGDPCSPGNSGRKRDLYGRQSCELPGGGPNPRGPVVSYKPGPPAPLCTANCGKLCDGFYCVPTPTGTPPDFASPTPKRTTTAADTATAPGTANNGGGFPTLPSNPGITAPPGQVCLSSTTAVECNGGPRGGVCMTSTKCASFGEKPTPTTTAAPNTNFISCTHRNQNPGQGIYTAYCVCDQSTFVESMNTAVTPHNSCAYTEKPTSTASIKTGFAPTTNTDTCQVCTRVGPNQQDCTTLSNCTPKPTTPPSSPSTRCITAHSYEANCLLPGDGMHVTLWDDGVEVCDVRQDLDEFKNNGEKEFKFDCGGGRSVTMGNNGRKLKYDAPDGSISLDAYSWQEDWHAQICALGTGSEFENVFDNGKCGNCPVQKLCGWVEKCYKFDGKCK